VSAPSTVAVRDQNCTTLFLKKLSLQALGDLTPIFLLPQSVVVVAVPAPIGYVGARVNVCFGFW